MASVLHKTKGIVLRTVKYGETSIIVSIFTELFGLQSYIVNGVRTSSKQGSGKANLFQPAAILDLVVYHHDLKNLQRIKEFRWSYIPQEIFSDIRKNAVSVFMVEILSRSLKQPEAHEELFGFAEQSLIFLDRSEPASMANLPLFYSLQIASCLGFRIHGEYSPSTPILDLKEGSFVEERPAHPHFIEEKGAEITSLLLKTNDAAELSTLKLNHDFRRNLLYAYEKYFALHVQDFGSLKTLEVLKEILN
jgi:DNA repair protein RecO (recombination protein O)